MLLTDRQYFCLAVLMYGLSTIYSVFLWRKGFRKDNWVNYGLLAVAMAFNLISLFKRGLLEGRCPVTNLYEATTFIAWTISATYLVLGLWSRLRFVGAFASPFLLAWEFLP